jgi:metal-sulfur cluster biosynthetic enzyme
MSRPFSRPGGQPGDDLVRLRRAGDVAAAPLAAPPVTPDDTLPTLPAPDAPPAAASTPDAPADAPADASAAPAAGAPTLDQVRLALRRVKDPELNLNIVDLGLVYDMAVEARAVRIDMSLTSPGCPSGPEIMGEAEQQLRALPGVEDVVVNLVWSPPWTPDRIEPRVRAYLGF